MDIAAIFRCDRCRLVSCQSSLNPGHSSTKGREKKKIAVAAVAAGLGSPSGGQKLGETPVSGNDYRPRMHPIWGQDDGKWESRSRVPLPGTRVVAG
jgi:hypothetical protein